MIFMPSFATDFHAMMTEETDIRRAGECKDTEPDSKSCKHGAK